ncbi:unnamed protein product [Macrosiphum euphorbiae]|uniref:Uncharacterized protein n=1 Tax=Macrosiphum euphorbiae TaxID=13131 RepID=A0AAV0X0T2_9HEMI|nr:unnamed protein product [Macrosiphum euphorbiae]
MPKWHILTESTLVTELLKRYLYKVFKITKKMVFLDNKRPAKFKEREQQRGYISVGPTGALYRSSQRTIEILEFLWADKVAGP